MPANTEHIAIAPFGTEHTSPQLIPVGCVSIETNSGPYLSLLLLLHYRIPYMHLLRASHTYVD